MAVVTFDKWFQGSASVGSSLWVDLGLIATGKRYWMGFVSLTAFSKVIILDVRCNTTGESAGELGKTLSLSKMSVRSGCTATTDLYKKGRIHVHSTLGTGVERVWLYLTAKSAIASDCMYNVCYNEEEHI